MSEKIPTPDLPNYAANTPDGGLKLMIDGEEVIIPPETMEEVRSPEAQAAAQELYDYGAEYEEELKRDGLYHP